MLPIFRPTATALFSALCLCLPAAAQTPQAPTPPAPPASTRPADTPAQVAPGTTQGEDIAKDPAVRESLPPESTPLGRNPPSLHMGESDPALQKGIDDSHKGTTGTTVPQGSRGPGTGTDATKDGTAPRSTAPAQ